MATLPLRHCASGMRLAFIFALISATRSAIADPTIVLTSPTNPVVFPEGDEFFTDIMRDRMDFDKRRDFMWEEGFDESSIVAAGGSWNGTFASTGAHVFPLFPGFGDNPATPDVNESALNAGRTGANFPIDTSKYSLVTYLDRTSNRSNRTLFWTREVFWPDGTLFATAEDGFYSNLQNNKFLPSAPLLALYDLDTVSHWTSQNTRGLRIDSSNAGAAGTSASYEWVRVSDPDSTTVIPLAWQVTDVVPVNGVPPRVSIYVDDDNQGFDGALLASWEQLVGAGVVDGQGKFERPVYTDATYNLPGSALPPGDYYFYLELWTNEGSDSKLSTSNYSAKVTITATPEVEIHAPSMTSGPDYATEVLGNPWDMAGAEDIDNLSNIMAQKNFQNEAFTGGIFQAEAIIPANAPPSQIESDVQVWLNVDRNNPIDSSKYRYLTYVLALDETGYGNISDKVGNDGGWVSRVVWWNTGIDVDGSVTNDNVIYEGLRAYSVDLADPNVLEPADEYPAQTGWLASQSWSFFRLDPAEVNDPTFFYLHDVKLTGKPAPTRDHLYTVKFSLDDADSELVTVALYTATDRNGTGSTIVWGPQALARGPQTITLDTRHWAGVDTYIGITANDGTNASTTWSSVPVTFAYTDGGSTEAPTAPNIDNVAPSTGMLVFSISKAVSSEIVTDFEVTCADLSQNVLSSSAISSPVTLTGLTDEIAYECVARAINGSGTSAGSVPVVVKSGLDSDGDGVIDVDDAFPDDPTDSMDTDGDGLGDNLETTLGTDPALADTDGDGVPDGEEVAEGSDPLDSDDIPVFSGLPIWLFAIPGK